MNEAIAIAMLGSSVISAIIASITTIITRKLDKKDKIAQIEKKVSSIERECTRTQMLLLMSDYSENKEEMMKCAKRYFTEQDGNFYMDSLFQKWLKKNDMEKPAWFNN